MPLPALAIPPTARRVLGAAALCAGVYFVSGALRGGAPREVEVTVSLARYDRPVRAVDVTFSRGGEVLRSLHRRFAGPAPGAFRATTSLPEGPVRAEVSVTLEGLVVVRSGDVRVAPGEPLVLPAPASP